MMTGLAVSLTSNRRTGSCTTRTIKATAFRRANRSTPARRYLRFAFTVGLGGLQAGGRYAQGNLKPTPLVDNGTVLSPTAGASGIERPWDSDVACGGVNDRASGCGLKPERPEESRCRDIWEYVRS